VVRERWEIFVLSAAYVRVWRFWLVCGGLEASAWRFLGGTARVQIFQRPPLASFLLLPLPLCIRNGYILLADCAVPALRVGSCCGDIKLSSTA
jgi:hypothetical protein